ncbi:MAG TPA: hypothetical protein VF777_07460 [Phycisphaerales bacterium]
MNRLAWRGVISGAAVLFVLFCGGVLARGAEAAWASAEAELVAVSKPELRKWLFQIGADPETLTVAGVSPASAAVAVSNARAFLASNLSNLNDLHRAAVEAVSQLAKVTPQDQTYDQVKASADAAVAARDSGIASLKSAVFAGLGSESAAVAEAVVRNRSVGLPLKYLVKDRTDAEWTTLREALAAAKAASDRGDTIDSQAAGIISAADADALVSAAATRLQSGLASVRAAWKQAIESE